MLALFEYAPLILFFIIYKTVDIFWATGVLIAASIIQLAYFHFKQGKVETKHWILFGLAVGLGSLTIAFQDEQFIKWKATLVYAGFGLTLLVSRYLFKANLMERMLMGVFNSSMESEQKIEVPKKIWDKINLFWIAILFSIAVVNIYVAYNFSLDFWVNFKVFGLTAVTFVCFIITIAMVYKYLPDEDNVKKKTN